MLGIDGQQLRASARDRLHEDVTGRDEALLVGQSQPAPLAHGFERRSQACSPHDGGHGAVRRFRGSLDQGCAARRATYARTRKRSLQLGIASLVPDNRQLCITRDGQLGQPLRVRVAGQRDDLEFLRAAGNEIERALAHRSRGTENRYPPGTRPSLLRGRLL